VAPDDSPIAGVRLKVPAGALSSKVKISVDGTLDPTPLSATAERVGPQIVVGPAGTTFASPVELTVPIDTHDVELHDQKSEDCKVWYRTDGEWQRIDRKTGAEGSITVDLPAPGVAAAGIVAQFKPSTCITNPAICRVVPKGPALTGCNDPSGFCFSKLPQPAHVPLQLNPEFAVSGRKLYYAHSPGAGRIGIARYDLQTGTSVLLGSVTLSGLISTSGSRIAVETDGSAWLALREHGNIKFKEGQVPLVFDRGVEDGRTKRAQGVAVTGSQAIRTYATDDLFMITEGAPKKVVPTPSFVNTLKLLPTAVSGKFIGFTTNRVFQLSFDDATATELVDVAGSNFDVATSPKSAGVASARNVESPAIDTTVWKTSSGTVQTFQSPTRMLAIDGDDNLYGAPTNVPELRLFTETGGEGVLPLTDAVAPSPEYYRMMPRAILGVKGRREVVVVVNGANTTVPQGVREFWLLQQADD
ncbi:MAG: hypothetical protein JNK82_22730, partial [Myxococcaceae bacterium]|nr:hypothetical protein [Myxococcaceae bacterium]